MTRFEAECHSMKRWTATFFSPQKGCWKSWQRARWAFPGSTPRSATPSQLRVELRSSLALPSLHRPVAGPDGASRVPTLSLRTWCGLKRMGALEDREQQFWYNLPDPSVPSASGMFIRSSKPIPGNWLRSLLWGPTWSWPFSDSIPYFPWDSSRLRESFLKWAWFETTTWVVPSSILSR